MVAGQQSVAASQLNTVKSAYCHDRCTMQEILSKQAKQIRGEIRRWRLGLNGDIRDGHNRDNNARTDTVIKMVLGRSEINRMTTWQELFCGLSIRPIQLPNIQQYTVLKSYVTSARGGFPVL
jgi:hypothetical protein